MTAARVSVAAATAAFAAWVLKGLAIGIAGGLDKSSLESPLFGVGLIAILVALGALGAAVTPGRPAWQRALAALGAMVVGAAITLGVQAVLTALLPESTGWVEEEAGLWAGSALVLAVALFWLRPRVARRAAA